MSLTTLFPITVFLVSMALILLTVRLNRRRSRGSRSAGAIDAVPPKQLGLHRTPWELRAIDDQIRAVGSYKARADVVETVNRLSKAAGAPELAFTLPPDAADHVIADVISNLELRLELPPLQPPPSRLGSANR